jgi:hypothetical protein
MKLPAFDHKEQRWDQWKEFYIGHGGREWAGGLFTQFTTGELICTSHFRTSSGWGNSSHSRGEFPKLNLSVFQLSDRWSPLNDGKQFWDPENQCFVKKSWMPQAMPMLWDRCVNRVVEVGWRDLNDKRGVPSRFAGRCRVYWAGEGRNPVGAPIQYHKLTEWSKEQRREAREKVAVIKAQVRIGVVKETQKYNYSHIKPTIKDLLSKPLSDMHDHFKLAVAHKGISDGRTAVEAEYLEVR